MTGRSGAQKPVKPQKDLVLEDKTDEAGTVVFSKVPVGKYTIRVAETEEFDAAEKKVKILVEDERIYEKKLFVGVSLK